MMPKEKEIARNFFEFGEKAFLDTRLKDDALFEKVVVNEDRLAKIGRKPLPDKRYVAPSEGFFVEPR